KIPRRAPDDLESHVIVYCYGSPVETLLRRLQQHGIRTLVAETDEEQARAALDRQQTVVFSRSDEDILDACRLDRARALVMNAPDEENAGAILRARQMGFRGEIYAFVSEPSHRMPMELAGATAAYTPRHIIAAALAAHASETISPRLPGFEMLGGRLQRRELRVPKGSPMVGRTLSDAGVGAASGAIVVGQWSHSKLNSRCTGEMKIAANAILELVGDEEALDKVRELIGGRYLRPDGPFLIAGFGEVGRKVHELLSDAGEEVRVIERRSAPGVDVVGDVLDAAVLERAGLSSARAVILALDSDDSTLFATVIIRDAVADVAVIARVNHERNVDNIHRAGADFALSVADISGEMLSARLLGRSSRDREDHRRVMPVAARGWAGMPLHRIPLRDNGCSALAIERNGVVLPVSREAVLEPNDRLWICGTRDGVMKIAEHR
ncbi:MAG TPA: NAD-binding protein, partial [Thermoanaerobaculia bacterium]|nr:NAD-binding protein [Thermoanaerobaculia bacterium]